MEQQPVSQTPSSSDDVKKTSYSVGKLYLHAWETVKKNFKDLAVITLIGVGVQVAVSAIIIGIFVNNFINDVESAIVSGLVVAAVAVIGGVFAGLLQIVALKKATEQKKIVVSEVVQESMKYVPRALGYGAFVVAIFIAAAIVSGVLGSVASILGLLFGLALFAVAIIAIFRYAFVQFLIVEDKPYGFMERFKLSQKMTDGIYGTLFLAWLMAVVLGIGAGIVGGILASPFQSDTNDVSTSFERNLENAESFEDFNNAIREASDEANNTNVDANYIIAQIITLSFSWGIGLIIMGAFLELYKHRKSDTKLG